MDIGLNVQERQTIKIFFLDLKFDGKVGIVLVNYLVHKNHNRTIYIFNDILIFNYKCIEVRSNRW
jgi:hypothetical protein